MSRKILRAAAGAFLLLASAIAAAQTAQAPIAVGTTPVAIAVNPVTNKVYVANQSSNTVTVIDARTRTTTTVNVGTAPMHVAVNPETNRIYVGNVTSANVHVIDGATDAVVATLATGGAGWTAVNPFTDRAYVLRYGAGDEVNILQGDTYALTSATRSYTPIALAVNPVNNYLYIVHQTTGDIVALDMTNNVPYPPRVCPDGAGGIRPFDEHEANPPACINVPDVPVAVAINPVSNRVYAVSSTATAQISVINGTNHTFTSLSPPGVGNVARAVAVNPITNKVYAAFGQHVVVVDGATNTMTVLPSGSGAGGPVAIGINMITNRIYVPNADGTLLVINGADNTTTSMAIPVGANSVAVNPVTNMVFVLGNEVTPIVGAGSGTGSPINATVTPLPGNAGSSNESITVQVTNTFTPAPLNSVRKLYYRFDSIDGPWQAASGSGPFTVPLTGLGLGAHTLYVYGTNGLDAPNINTTPQHTPVVGAMASYAFTISSTPPAAPAVTLSRTSVAFGGQSMNTTSPAETVTVTNSGNAALSVTSIGVTAQFAQSNNCPASLAAGASCTVSITFSPAVAAGGLNSTVAVNGTLTITSNAASSPNGVPLSGTAQKSLVTHYYRSILKRAPEASGYDHWSNEAARVAALGAHVNETWYAMAAAFFRSAEYMARNTTDSAFLDDVYRTFFNRAPDASGLAHWSNLLANGMPREVVIAEFMFSAEFAAFTQAIFGNPTVRPEIDMVMDFYRGLLARLPDDGGFNYYLGRFRTAQCQGQGSNGAPTYAEVESITSFFINSPEYAARGRSNAQFVGDLYNAFLRRGGDADGVQYWIGQLNSGARTRENVRQYFISSPEFSQRVTRVVSTPCNT